MKRVLIAIGGNALYDKDQGNNLELHLLREVCFHIAHVVKRGYLPIITFGNGPQVGNLLAMAEKSADLFPSPIPLDTCVSWTQGEIGYWLANEIYTQLINIGLDYHVVAINTTVEVSPEDPAFQKPSKPVGRFLTQSEAQELYEDRGYIVTQDAGRGYRRLVPSPKPLKILEERAIQKLVEQNIITLCCGGGGVPVFWSDEGVKGIEAVIDKDYTSCLLAKNLQIENLIICTEVDYVYLNYGTSQEKALGQMTLAEAERYLAEGQFSEGSMGPKVAALIDYLKSGGKRALITSIPQMSEALDGNVGTAISCSL